MPKLTLFHLDDCPYCHAARRAIEALRSENPAYADIEVEWVEESRQPERVKGYDYWYVPTVFLGHELRIRCIPAVDHQYFIVADNDGGIRLAYVHEDDTQEGFLSPCPVNR